MHKTFSFIIIDARNPDLPKNNRAVCGGTAPNLNQVLFKVECDELSITQTCRARPHLGFMLIPMPSGLDYGRLDLW